jgi:thiol-disulfide isomerase/thioredoxin
MFAKSSISDVFDAATTALLVGLVCLLAAGTAEALRKGEAPPPIGLSDTNGTPVDLEALQGKVVVVDFWASWCGPCREEMPVLEALHRKYEKKGLVIVGVNIDRNKKKMNNFLKGSPVTFRIVPDPKLEVAARYEPPAMPTSYFIGKDGTLRYMHEGFHEEDVSEIESRLQALLAE